MAKEIEGNITPRQIRGECRQGDSDVILMWEGAGSPGAIAGEPLIVGPTGGAAVGSFPPAGTVTHTGPLTADLPVIGNGGADIKVGTKSGSTDEFATSTGTKTSGHLATWDSNGNLVDGGAPSSGYPGVTTDGANGLTVTGGITTGGDIGIGTASPGHPLEIDADDPLSGGIPVEQVMIRNTSTTGGTKQANIAFNVWDGAAQTTVGWVGVTNGNFIHGPYPNATYLENNSTGGVVILSDDPTNGTIKLFTGGYASNTYLRLTVGASGTFTFTGFTGTGTQLAAFDSSGNLTRLAEAISTDGTLGGDSDGNIPTEKAVKTYVDAHIGTPTTHSESLTDGSSNFIFAAGDVVTVVGVAN